tara:strand:+ start:124 stop:759 length:636 start_codon:yes stop_codon:yes gene_type:complete
MLNDFIYYSDDPVLPASTCKDLISKFEQCPHKRSGITGSSENELMDEVKKSTDIHITSTPGFEEEDKVCRKHLFDQIKHYQSLIEAKIPIYFPLNQGVKYMGFNMQRTNPGEYYHWHCDEDVLNNKWARSITYIFYLNDIHNDGYTEFYNGLKIQPKQGHCLIFPATWSFVHRGYPPKDETKYIITGWLYSHGMTAAVTDPVGRTRPHYED